jgi:hypothetical protein
VGGRSRRGSRGSRRGLTWPSGMRVRLYRSVVRKPRRHRLVDCGASSSAWSSGGAHHSKHGVRLRDSSAKDTLIPPDASTQSDVWDSFVARGTKFPRSSVSARSPRNSQTRMACVPRMPRNSRRHWCGAGNVRSNALSCVSTSASERQQLRWDFQFAPSDFTISSKKAGMVDVAIRDATVDDSQTIATLVSGLGYPTTTEKMRKRLESILADKKNRGSGESQEIRKSADRCASGCVVADLARPRPRSSTRG